MNEKDLFRDISATNTYMTFDCREGEMRIPDCLFRIRPNIISFATLSLIVL